MTEPRLVSLSCRCAGVSPEAFLAAARGRERFYWRDDEVTFVGIGVAAEIIAWGEGRFQTVREKAQALFNGVQVLDGDGFKTEPLAYPRLFGGFSFQPDFITEHTWAKFAPAYFVLPHFQMMRKGEESWLTINIQLSADEALHEDELRTALEEQCAFIHELPLVTAGSPQPPRDVNYPMSLDKWSAMIEAAVREMRDGALNKVVLSRVCELRFDENVDVDSALAYLNEAYTGCYRFLFEPIPHLAFFGATPELLLNVEGDQIRTMALAGTIKRGETSADDAALAATILADPKERYEHQLVVDGIRERLTPLTTELNIGTEPGILQLKNLQHLYTPVSGALREKSGVLPLLEIMHPTPALGGQPREAALDFIRRAEPVPRGWYASPVGWIDSNLDGTFAVAIRSAVSQNERVWLYSGAGIVEKSQPQKEWDETALKFKPMLNALGAQYVRA